MPKQQVHRQMTVDITHDCIWILNADKHLRFLQSEHLQCRAKYQKMEMCSSRVEEPLQLTVAL